MKKVFSILFLSFFSVSICLGQSKEISRENFESIKIFPPYDYLGDTFFKRTNISNGRSIIIRADWNKISFNKSDSTLELMGSVYDNSNNKNYIIYSGKLANDTVRQKAEIINPVEKSLNRKEKFTYEIKINSNEDILCIVIPAEKTESEIMIVSQIPLIYKIGELIK